ncbi:MAG: Rpn family recombination-promoting nuclease/putative transposase [Desulfatirhabdiaceae bacterium]
MAKLIRFDWAIKSLLRNKANFDVLEGFLSALLNDNEIRILNILESEGNQNEADHKFNRVDMMIEDCHHRKIIVEIQNTRESDYLERLLFGTSKVIVDNHQLGHDYRNISKVISISVMYFNLGIGDDYLYYGTTDFRGMNTGNALRVRKRVELLDADYEKRFHFEDSRIFPEYYLIQVERYQDVIKKAIDEWIYMIKNNEVKEGSTSRNIDKAREKLSELNMSPEERIRYERFLINAAIERDVVNTAKEEGWDEGRKEGRKEGKEEGRREEKMEIARNMLDNGLTIDQIVRITGLTIEEIGKKPDDIEPA